MADKRPSLGSVDVERGKDVLKQLGFTLDESWFPKKTPEEPKAGQKIPRGWGYEVLLATNELYRSKFLYLDVGSKTSLHFHIKKFETIYVMSGEFAVISISKETGNNEESIIRKGDLYINPPYSPHEIRCIMKGELLEISNNDYPDDVYRISPGDGQRKKGKR
jgi:mannose-6-phosphate isomerase-like protein (cupin superfamily)